MEEKDMQDFWSPSVIINTTKISVTESESRILVYLYNVPDSLKATQKIFQKFLNLWQNYNGLSLKLRTMKMKGLVRDISIKGGKEKAWEINPKYREEIYKTAMEVHQLTQKMKETSPVLQEKGDVLPENGEK